MKRKFLLLLFPVLLIICVIIICVIFYRPRHFHGSYTACSLEGDTVSVEFDVVLHKGLWNGDKLTGSVFVDGKEYVSPWDLFGYFSDNAKSFKSKTRFEFWKPADYIMESHGDRILLELHEEGQFDCFRITTLKALEEALLDPLNSQQLLEDVETEIKEYYGPATSWNEVEEIQSEWRN